MSMQRSKVLLVNPLWTFFDGTNRRPGGPPSTIATVATALNEYFDVDIYDFMASDNTVVDGKNLVWGKPIIDFVELISKSDYKAVGFTSTWTVQHPNAMFLSTIVKLGKPDVVTFCGGHAVSVSKDVSGFDFIVSGEVENCVKEIAQAIIDRDVCVIEGIAVDNIDMIDFPLYEKLDLSYYHKAARNHHGSTILGGIPFVTSRGCPFDCSFCTVHNVMGHRWRPNSSEYVIDHIKRLTKKFGFFGLHFEDDNLIVSKDRFMRIMDGMASIGGISWDTPNGVRLDTLDDDVLLMAQKSGCVELRVSIEAASDKTRNSGIGKKLSIDNIADVATKCKELGIRLCSFYVVGIPGETVEDMENTLRLASKLETEYSVVPRYSIATPFPGTKLYDECVDNDWIERPYNEASLAEATHKRGLIKTSDFTPDDINEVYRKWKNNEL